MLVVDYESMAKPRQTDRSNTIRSCLEATIVPVFVSKHRILAIRALWEVCGVDTRIAELNIWNKRQQLEDLLLRESEVVAFFSCITALTKRKVGKKRKRKDDESSDAESDGELELNDTTVIPGKKDSFKFYYYSEIYAILQAAVIVYASKCYFISFSLV